MRKTKNFFIGLLAVFMIMTVSSTAFAKEDKSGSKNSLNESFTPIQNPFLLNGGTVVEIQQGETVEIPLVFTKIQDKNAIQPLMDFYGDAGKLSLTAVGNKVEYKITMSEPATSFLGDLSITNLTSGLSSGRAAVGGFSGSIGYSAKFNNRYGASLTGTAYFLNIPVATTMPNYITWVYN